MGGGSRFPYPKWVWTYYGGWWNEPKYAVTNGVITFAGMMALASVGFSYSRNAEIRLQYPHFWIPSMLWAKEFHDPAFKAYWEEQLKKEGREWIEPIPASMKSWWPLYREKS